MSHARRAEGGDGYKEEPAPVADRKLVSVHIVVPLSLFFSATPTRHHPFLLSSLLLSHHSTHFSSASAALPRRLLCRPPSHASAFCAASSLRSPPPHLLGPAIPVAVWLHGMLFFRAGSPPHTLPGFAALPCLPYPQPASPPQLRFTTVHNLLYTQKSILCFSYTGLRILKPRSYAWR